MKWAFSGGLVGLDINTYALASVVSNIAAPSLCVVSPVIYTTSPTIPLTDLFRAVWLSEG